MKYTYLIGWKEKNVWYYGVRYARGCKPEDLFTSYFTSSKYVHECMRSWGLPDVIQVRKTFEKRHNALVWEQKVLRRMQVLNETKWLNKNISGGIAFDDVIRKKMSLRKLGRIWVYNEDGKIMIDKDLESYYLSQGYKKGHGQSQKGEKNNMYGKKHSAESKAKIGKTNSRSTLTEEGRKVKAEFTRNNNPMDNPDIRAKHREATKASGTSSRKVTDGYKEYSSIRSANEDYPEVKYQTLYSWVVGQKNGWNYC
jgi:hypothetical protein